MSEMILKGGTLIVPGDSPGVVRAVPGDLAIRSGLILAAGDEGAVPEDFDPEVIDVSGRLVMPGLVNAHGHAGMTLLRGYADDLPLMEWLREHIWPIEAQMTAEDVEVGTALAVVEMLLGGTTCFADMYFPMDRVASVVSDMGIRGVLSQGLIGLDSDVERDMRVSRDFAEKWHEGAGGRITVQLGPHAAYTCPPEYLERVARLASDLGVGIHTHLEETPDERQNVRGLFGKDPVDCYLEAGIFDSGHVTVAHGVHLDERAVEVLVEHGVGLAHCPRSNLRLACGIAPVEDMLDAGMLVGLGTDGAASSATLDMWEEMRFAGYLQKGTRLDARALPAERLLYLATRGGALALGLEDVGELAPGFRADVVVVNLDDARLAPGYDAPSQLAYCAGPSDVERVIVDGEHLVAGGNLLGHDASEIVLRARAKATELVERVEDR